MRASVLGRIITLSCITLLLLGCNDEWIWLGDGIGKKLVVLGDCTPAMNEAEYFIIDTEYRVSKPPMISSGGHYTIYYHNLNDSTQLPWEGRLHERIQQELLTLNCGDAIALYAPVHTVNKTFLCAFKEFPPERADDAIEIHMKIMKTFDEQGFRDFLMSSAQHGEMSETEAIELLLMNNTALAYEKHGDCFIQPIAEGKGDTIGPGSEVTIAYTTHLMNDKPLDEPSELQFSFGRPDQVVEGLHYALSMMRQGDEAIVYLPSYLAFGEDGSTGGVVSLKTPVYFKLKVVDVKN